MHSLSSNILVAYAVSMYVFCLLQQAPIEGLNELASEIMGSPQKTYLLSMIFVIVGVLFIMGLMCGRVTKRVAAQAKNK